MYGWTLEWAKDAQGEIGKVKPLPANWVEVDVLRPCLMEAGFGALKGRRK
jgi:hypothetical protein